MKINWDELKLGISCMNPRQAVAVFVLAVPWFWDLDLNLLWLMHRHPVWVLLRTFVGLFQIAIVFYMLRDREKPN